MSRTLSNEWDRMHDLMVGSHLTGGEIEIVRLAFFFGARAALVACTRDPLTIATMVAEIRAAFSGFVPDPEDDYAERTEWQARRN